MLLLSVVSVGALVISAGDRVRIAESDGVVVYRHEGTPFIELTAEGVLEAPPELVRQVLLDYESHPMFVDNLQESRVLERREDALVVYQRLHLPILSDRDFTLEITWGADGTALWTHFSTANTCGPPPRDGIVRLNVHDGGWRLLPVNGDRATRAIYHVRMDLAGSLPGWMGRSQAGKRLPALFEGIREQLLLRRAI